LLGLWPSMGGDELERAIGAVSLVAIVRDVTRVCSV
jgi:hypothetical protein